MNQKILNTSELKNVIGFQPTPCQQEILDNLKRLNFVVGGRRAGKSYLISYLALRELLTANKEIWVVSPIYNLAKIIFNNLTFWINRHFSGIFKINVSDMTIVNTFNGSKLTLKSADNLASLKGQGLDLLVIDEAGMIDEEVFTRYLRAGISENRPALNGEKGRLIVTGNASALGSWFHRLWQEKSENQFSYHWPIAVEDSASGEILATNNSLVEIEELKQIKKTTPNFIWQSEYMACWLSPEASLFKNVRGNILDNISKGPKPGRFYCVGVDLARKEDFSVISVIDSATFELVYFNRFNQIDWPFQRKKIIEVAHIYNNAKVLIDSTGLGDVILSDLMRAEVFCEGFMFTSESKKQLLEKLAVYIETGRIKYPNIPELTKELEVFGFEVSLKTGRVIYSAPSGYHDDCVISLALACWGLPEQPLLKSNISIPHQELLKMSSQLEIEKLLTDKIDKSEKRERYRPAI